MHASLGLQRAATAGVEAASTSGTRPAFGRSSGAGTKGAMAPLFAPARAVLMLSHHYQSHRSALVAAARLALSAAAASSTTTGSSGHRRALSAAAASASPSPPTAPPSPPAPPSATLVDAAQRERLASFLDHLLLTNESMNLTAVRDRGEAWTRHVEDSLALVPVIERWAAKAAAAAAAAGRGTTTSAAAAAAAAAGAGAADNATLGKKKSGKDRRPKRQLPPQQQAWFEEVALEEQQQAPPGPPAPADATTTTPTIPVLRLIDVGTGPGLPGMVLAIARPTWRVTLLDSLRKRCDFLRLAAARLNLTNVDVVWSRAEDAGRQPSLRDAHDVAVARAVAETRVLAELCLPFVKTGGVWVAAKGAAIEGEVKAAAKAIAALQGRVLAVEAVDSFYASGAAVPPSGLEAGKGGAKEGEEDDDDDAAAAAAAAAAVRRTAIVVEKLAPTPSAYPRPPGTPNKKPL